MQSCWTTKPIQALANMLMCALLAIPAAQAAEIGVQRVDVQAGISAFPSLMNYWGLDNLSVIRSGSDPDVYLRVFIPKGAIDPRSMKQKGLPVGGTGFKSRMFPTGVKHAILSYRVRFPTDFDFVRGGKLPGLFGGKGNSGGKIPDGTDGFSFRLMWGKGGRGSVYAYLPSSIQHGSGLFVHKMQFERGKWHRVRMELLLNSPNHANGKLRMWLDDRLLGEENSLLVRTVESLNINGLFFDVFFGGNDPSWAASKNTYVDFADFEVQGFSN